MPRSAYEVVNDIAGPCQLNWPGLDKPPAVHIEFYREFIAALEKLKRRPRHEDRYIIDELLDCFGRALTDYLERDQAMRE